MEIVLIRLQDYLRHVSYAFTSGQKTHHADESDWSKTRHVDHCIDYLRQVLTCHGVSGNIHLELFILLYT